MKTSYLFLFLFPCVLALSGFAQGPLTPPGTPAPLFKTLQQIEPRIDLQNAPASAVDTTNPSYHFIVNQPGSYYLSGNVGVTKVNGIQINAEGVTLDLNGFQVSRSSGNSGNGIEIAPAAKRPVVRNGSIKGFGAGVFFVFVAPNDAQAGLVRDLAVSGCTSYGIGSGIGSVIESCRVYDNSGQAGIYAHFGSVVSNCTAVNNNSQYGIYADNGSTVIHCSAFANTSNQSTSAGIATGGGCTVVNCSAFQNTTGAGPTSTTGMGFLIGASSTIRNCTALQNRGDGIQINSDSVARENTCDSNGFNGDGAGIYAASDDNRIEGNNLTGNDRGLDVDGAGNIIIKNTASGNTTAWTIAIGNAVAPIVSASTNALPISGSTYAGSLGSTDPNANYTY